MAKPGRPQGSKSKTPSITIRMSINAYKQFVKIARVQGLTIRDAIDASLGLVPK